MAEHHLCLVRQIPERRTAMVGCALSGKAFIKKNEMKQVIDLDNWNRKEHFAFFSAFDDPFFGVTTLVDFTDVYRQSKEQNVSFFLYSLHFLLKCVNETDAFKLRIEKDSVVRYDTIHISPTIGREDGTFGFGFLNTIRISICLSKKQHRK